MYQPPHFREERLEIQHALIKAHPLGLLINSGEDGPTPMPFPSCSMHRPHRRARSSPMSPAPIRNGASL